MEALQAECRIAPNGHETGVPRGADYGPPLKSNRAGSRFPVRFLLARRLRLGEVMLKCHLENGAAVGRWHTDADIGKDVDIGLMEAIYCSARSNASYRN